MRLLKVAAAALAVAAVLFATNARADANCSFIDDGCAAKIVVTEYTGPPPIPVCLNGHPIVQILMKAKCKRDLDSASDTFLRCGVLSLPITISYNGNDHTITPTGGNWEDVLAGDCSVLKYTVQ